MECRNSNTRRRKTGERKRSPTTKWGYSVWYSVQHIQTPFQQERYYINVQTYAGKDTLACQSTPSFFPPGFRLVWTLRAVVGLVNAQHHSCLLFFLYVFRLFFLTMYSPVLHYDRSSPLRISTCSFFARMILRRSSRISLCRCSSRLTRSLLYTARFSARTVLRGQNASLF